MGISSCPVGLVRCLGLLLGVVLATDHSVAQSLSDSNEEHGNRTEATGRAAGGAAMADFDTLMNLIQQTIDPDSWLINGGNSSILPYPSGVLVDPAGQIRRVEVVDAASPRSSASATRRAWRQPSPRRTISLRRLDSTLQQVQARGLALLEELQSLAGLSRIDEIEIDWDNEDLLISGPAGKGVHGFRLEDIALVVATVNANTSPLGCSIEPSDDGLRRVQRLIAEPAVRRRLARAPKRVAQQMQSAIGSHTVRFFGIDPRRSTASALLDADEHMKQVGFGNADTPEPIRNYFDFLEQQAQVPDQSLIRWWFSYTDNPVLTNPQHDWFRFPKQTVRVMSEQQWLTVQGRTPTGKRDPAAEAFADEITNHLDSLRQNHPAYARLHAVFELSLACQLALETTEQPDLAAWFPTLCVMGEDVDEQVAVAKTVPGLAATHRLSNGTVLAVISGGVKVDAFKLSEPSAWQQVDAKRPVVSISDRWSPRVDAAVGPWWWD